jgi:hypothetical protein
MSGRIQRKRAKGWRMPEGAVTVTRPTRWGNPFPISPERDRDEAVRLYREYAEQRVKDEPGWLEPLRGKVLCCWCGPDQLCHADVLLALLARS